MARSLSLKRETLAELVPAELTSVAGGAQTLQGPTCPLLYCLVPPQSEPGSCYCCGATASCA